MNIVTHVRVVLDAELHVPQVSSIFVDDKGVETTAYYTPDQARGLAALLIKAADASEQAVAALKRPKIVK